MARLYWRDSKGQWRDGLGHPSKGPKRKVDLRKYPRRKHRPPDVYVPPKPKPKRRRKPKPKPKPPKMAPRALPVDYTSTFRHFLMPIQYLPKGEARKIFALVDVLALKAMRKSPGIMEGMKERGRPVRETTRATLPVFMLYGTRKEARGITIADVESMTRYTLGTPMLAFRGLYCLRHPDERSELMGDLRCGELS